MARRATYFLDADKDENPKLFVSGGWEFVRPNGIPSTSKQLSGLATSYNIMNYDIAFLGKQEAEILKKYGVTADNGRKTSEQSPFSAITMDSGASVGFLRLPSLNTDDDTPSNSLVKKISRLVKMYRPKVQLLIGLSDWGWLGERDYLAKAPKDMPDILLGSGSGSGVNGRIEADGRCVWVRPYDKGRTVSEVQVFTWPDRTKPFTWNTPEKITILSVGLGDQYQDAPEVSAILH